MRALALAALDGVGDSAAQWEEWTGYAWHARRRLTPAEAEHVGGVVDVRGTDDAYRRFDAAKTMLPIAGVALAMQELQR